MLVGNPLPQGTRKEDVISVAGPKLNVETNWSWVTITGMLII